MKASLILIFMTGCLFSYRPDQGDVCAAGYKQAVKSSNICLDEYYADDNCEYIKRPFHSDIEIGSYICFNHLVKTRQECFNVCLEYYKNKQKDNCDYYHGYMSQCQRLWSEMIHQFNTDVFEEN